MAPRDTYVTVLTPAYPPYLYGVFVVAVRKEVCLGRLKGKRTSVTLKRGVEGSVG